MTWGNVDLNKGLVNAATTDKAIEALKDLGQLPEATPGFGSTTPASVNLNGTSEIAVGFNIGAMYNINDQWTVGASYRSKMGMKVKAGNANVKYANAMAQSILGESLDLINKANFKAEMPCPWVLSLGVSYKPIDRLTLALDGRLTGWNAYKSLDVEFLSEQLTPYNQYITKNYNNSWCFSFGAEFALTHRMDLRAGLMVDTTPVNDNLYNPETPGMTKIEPTIGFSFRPIENLSIDLGFMYVAGCGIKNASCEYADLLGKMMPAKLTPAITGALMQQGLGADAAAQMAQTMVAGYGFESTGKFTADYKLHAFIPSIGISCSF